MPESTRRPPRPAEQLRAARTALGLTQAQLADRLSVHRVTLARWESGAESPAFPRMLALALEALTRRPNGRRK